MLGASSRVGPTQCQPPDLCGATGLPWSSLIYLSSGAGGSYKFHLLFTATLY
jgi:hypothetical protein